VTTIVIAMFPVLKCLRLADSNAAGMDKIYYYARRTSESLRRTKHSFNGQKNRVGFEYRHETHVALGKSATASRLDGVDLRCVSSVEHCLTLDDNDDEEYVASFNCDDGEMDADIDDDASVASFASNGSQKVADTLKAGLGNHIEFLWEKRKPQLVSDFAVLGWLVLVVPEIRLDAKNYNGEQRDRAEQALRQLWYPMSAIEDDFQRNLNKFFLELGLFHNKEGPYATPRIWNDINALTGQSHLWHKEHTMRFEYTSLGFTACRVASKILGIGAAERSWGDVKRIIGDRRLSLGSKKIHQQSVIYTSNCIQAKKKELNLDDHSWKEWDLHIDEFNKHLEQRALVEESDDASRGAVSPQTNNSFFGHFIESGKIGASHRLFKAYEQKGIEGYHPKQDPVVEAAILTKYGGLFLADPDIDGKELVLKINCKHLLYQADKRGPNRTYCVYGMAPDKTMIDKNTELFVVDKCLIDRVVCAENDFLNVVDADGQPVIAASYRQNEFPPSDNISWGFVAAQKRFFPDSQRESED
jgi:hypothetical protein